MSLDIFIVSPEPIKKKSTGIYARIVEEEIETDDFWCGNITHNLAEMAKRCFGDEYSLYDLLWRDEEPDDLIEYVAQLLSCLVELQDRPDKYKQYNPSNGWGTYEQLVEFVRSFIHALIDMPPGSTIEYSK